MLGCRITEDIWRGLGEKMRSLGKKCMAVCMAAVLGVSVASTAGAAEQTAGMKAKVVDGQVYVSAADLVKSMGGNGQYDTKTGTYQYKGNDSIPKVIEKVSPSVVGIIGKADAGQEGVTTDRYNLAH